jgi:hypothetical protein
LFDHGMVRENMVSLYGDIAIDELDHLHPGSFWQSCSQTFDEVRVSNVVLDFDRVQQIDMDGNILNYDDNYLLKIV